MSAIETERGVGRCPERPEGFGHVWAGANASGDASNPCRVCETSGRAYFKAATRGRLLGFVGIHLPMESGTGKAWPKGQPEEMAARAAAIVEDKKRRDAEAVANGTARPGQIAGAPKGKAK